MKSWMVLFVVLLFACSQDRQSGKGVWDETENGVAVLVLDSIGKPLGSAKVRLIPIQDWSSQVASGANPVSDSAEATEDGQAFVKGSRWPAALEVEKGDLVARIILNGPNDTHEVSMKKGTELAGSVIDDGTGLPDQMRIAGSTFQAKVGMDGHFLFPSVPDGEMMLVAAKQQALTTMRSFKVKSNETLILDSLPMLNAREVLLDDFSDEISANLFFYLTGMGWWYTYADSTSEVVPSNVSDAMGNGELHAILKPDTLDMTSIAMVGVDIEGSVLAADLSYARHDFSLMDSLCFMAKGEGLIQFQVSGIDSMGEKTNTYAEFTLVPTWNRYCFEKTDFLNWNLIGENVAGIGFAAQHYAEIWLDQIVIYGMTEQEIFSSF